MILVRPKVLQSSSFADDSNLVQFSKSVNKFNKYINIDMKNLTNWLHVNKILLNVKKAN